MSRLYDNYLMQIRFALLMAFIWQKETCVLERNMANRFNLKADMFDHINLEQLHDRNGLLIAVDG